jgi:hypothetical protein
MNEIGEKSRKIMAGNRRRCRTGTVLPPGHAHKVSFEESKKRKNLGQRILKKLWKYKLPMGSSR